MPLLTYGTSLKWRVGNIMTTQISAASTEQIQVSVLAYEDGQPVNPDNYTVQFGFVLTTVQTVPTQWVVGTWDTTGSGLYVAQCLVGPNGVQTLTAGEYFIWVQITAGDETIVRQVGTMEVF